MILPAKNMGGRSKTKLENKTLKEQVKLGSHPKTLLNLDSQLGTSAMTCFQSYQGRQKSWKFGCHMSWPRHSNSLDWRRASHFVCVMEISLFWIVWSPAMKSECSTITTGDLGSGWIRIKNLNIYQNQTQETLPQRNTDYSLEENGWFNPLFFLPAGETIRVNIYCQELQTFQE